MWCVRSPDKDVIRRKRVQLSVVVKAKRYCNIGEAGKMIELRLVIYHFIAGPIPSSSHCVESDHQDFTS